MQGSTKIPITDLNAHITCKICNGYFVDASTIIECLHTFCRSCIIRYLQKNKYCPVCDVQVHKSKPLLNIRPDKTLQDIVYKLVPRLFQNEMQRRREFYESHSEAKPSSLEQCGEVAYQYLLTPEETICLTLSYYGADNKPRYLRCPAAVTMGHLKKLIRAKYDLSENHRVDILYNQDCLSSSLTLIDIAYIYLWKRKGPIELTYRIYENTTKKMKLEHLDDVEKVDINNINNNDISNNNNWKEVQLRISENGEMSITGIQDSLSPSLLEIVNSEPKYKNEVTVADPMALIKQQQQTKKELPGLKYIGKVNTPCTLPPTTSNPLPIDNLNILSANVGNFVKTISTTVPTLTLPIVSNHIILSQPSSSSSCATLSSGSTTTVFSTINTSKCSTKTEESTLNVVHTDDNKERKGEKGIKRKIEANFESEPPAKQPKPIILNHNIGLHNLSNNHPLIKHAKMNRNGENVRDLPNAKISSDSDIKFTDDTSVLTKPNDFEIMKQSFNKKMDIDTLKINLNKNFAHSRMGSSTSTSKPLAMRAKTLISESGVKPPCYQPRTIYNPLINVPRPLNNLNSAATISISIKSDNTRTLSLSSTRTTTVKNTDKSSPITSISIAASQSTQNSTPKSSITSQSQTNHIIAKPTSIVLNISNKPQSNSPTPLSQTVVNTSNKIPSIIPVQQAQVQCNPNGNKVSSTIPSQVSPNSIQDINNKLPITSPSQQSQPIQSTSSKTSTTISTTPPQSCQNPVAKTPNCTIKSKPSTPIGYKTLRDPPKSWNSQISKANLSKSSPDPKYPDLKNVRPAKFFKMRNNMPRYLGNPASGVKPMYQVHVSPEKDKPQETMKTEKSEIKKHSIVKIDPKTLKPVSEKAPETTNLSNHSIILHTPNLNTQMGQLYPNPNQCLTTAVTTMNSSLLNIQNDLKINTSSVSITNPLKLQSSSPKNERKSPKSPHSPKIKITSSPTGNKRDNKIARNFTPPNPFVPNIPTKPSLSPNQFIYPAMPPGFPTYDPRVMAAYYNQWYSQRMPFPSSALSGLTLDLNQRKSLEILTSPGSPNIDVLAQSMLNHQMPSRPTPPTSINISTLQRSHNIPLSPTITKLPSVSHKKAQKDPKTDKSLETVVEKMTQNRNKINTKSQTDSSKKEPEIKMSVPETPTNDVNSGKKTLDQKLELNKLEKNDSGTNQLLKIATSNMDKNGQHASDKADFKVEQKSKEALKSSSNSKISDQTENKPEKAKETLEKENSNTENNVQSKEKLVDKKSEVISTEDSVDRRENVTELEVKEKECQL